MFSRKPSCRTKHVAVPRSRLLYRLLAAPREAAASSSVDSALQRTQKGPWHSWRRSPTEAVPRWVDALRHLPQHP